MTRRDPEHKLAVELLRACRLAHQSGLPGVAEHVLCAIEELARCAPAQREFLETAYLELLTRPRDGAPLRE